MSSNHRVLSFACLIFVSNVMAARCCKDPWLPAAWLFVLLTSIYHHHAPTVRSLAWLDKSAVYHLVFQNGRYALFRCPTWVGLCYMVTVFYSASWYYLVRCTQRQRLYFHLVMYALTSASGHVILFYNRQAIVYR